MQENTALQQAPSTGEQVKEQIARMKRKRSRKKIIFGTVALLLAGVVAFEALRPKDTRPMVETVALQRDVLIKQVNLNGEVESSEAARVYSNETGLVTHLDVKLGDRVEAGDLLCRLDTRDIETSIRQKQAEMEKTVQLAQLSLQDSALEYENLSTDMAAGNYSELISAQQRINAAQIDFTDARRNLDDHKDDLEYADEQMNQAERALSQARLKLSRAQKNLREAVASGNQSLIAQREKELDDCEAEYNTAYDGWHDANDKYGEDVSDYSKVYRQARLDYTNALENKDAIERETIRRLTSLQNAMKRAEINSDMSVEMMQLQDLQRRLEDSTLRAPVSGVITELHAVEGMPGNGLMFVIEDIDRLQIDTVVREFDVSSVTPGMPAVIKSDATGEREIEGEVLSVAPAARRNASATSSTVEFESKVAVKEPDSGLRIGMNVRLNVILQKKPDVMAVSFDALTTDEQGNDCVFVARADAEGNYTAHRVVVQTGLETDFAVEIISDALQPGDLVITTPAAVTEGAAVRLASEVAL